MNQTMGVSSSSYYLAHTDVDGLFPTNAADVASVFLHRFFFSVAYCFTV